ncbi:MAG: hypothetical protein AB7G93_12900 [Bdellovibrionales bacterium]
MKPIQSGKKLWLLLVFLLSLAERPATASTGDHGLVVLWNRIFAAPPGPVEPHFISRLLGVAPNCSLPAQIESQVLAYRQLIVSAASPGEIKNYGKALENQARALAAQPSSSCRDLALATYGAASVALLTDIWMDQGYRYYYEGASDVPHLHVDSAWVFFAIGAARAQIINYNTMPSRSAQAQRRMVGYYDCGNTKIGVDPAQTPLNLGASIVHEFTHFFLDKNSALNSPSHAFPQSHFLQLIILDETIASLHAGALQRRFAQKYLRGNLTPERIGDLSFFSSAGPLAHYDEFDSNQTAIAQQKWGIYRFSGAIHPLFDDRLRMNLCPDLSPGAEANTYQLCPDPTAPRDPPSFRDDLYQRVARIYFNRQLNPGELWGLSPQGLDQTIPGFWRVQPPLPRTPDIEAFFLPFRGLALPDGVHLRGERFSLPEAYHVLSVLSAGGAPINLMPSAKIALLGLAAWFGPESRLCSQFKNAVRGGQLQDYIGTKLDPSGKSGDNGVMPGDNGVMPAGSIRPCLEIGDRFESKL